LATRFHETRSGSQNRPRWFNSAVGHQISRHAKRIAIKSLRVPRIASPFHSCNSCVVAPARRPIEPYVPAGLVRFAVPEGKQAITLRLRESGPEQLGRCLSVISAAVVCWLSLRPRRKPGGWHGP